MQELCLVNGRCDGFGMILWDHNMQNLLEFIEFDLYQSVFNKTQ